MGRELPYSVTEFRMYIISVNTIPTDYKRAVQRPIVVFVIISTSPHFFQNAF